MAQGLNNFQGVIPNVRRHVFRPSLSERQHQSDSIKRTVAAQDCLRLRPEETQEAQDKDEDQEKGKKWKDYSRNRCTCFLLEGELC